MVQKVLIYNISGQKAVNVKVICRKLGVSFDTVEKADYGKKLGYLAGITDDSSVRPGEDFNEEMLLLINFGNSTLNSFLSELRRKKSPVALKAVLTETNSEYTSCELFREISAEHRAMKRGETAH